jgi:hypothetical protein
MGVLPGRRLSHQLPDPLHGRRVETGQGAYLDFKPPILDPLEQLLALQSQLFRQLVNTRGQRQLLPELTPDGRGKHDLGMNSSVMSASSGTGLFMLNSPRREGNSVPDFPGGHGRTTQLRRPGSGAPISLARVTVCRPPRRQTRMGRESGTVWLRLVAVLRLLFMGSTFLGSARRGGLDRTGRTVGLADWGRRWTRRTGGST